MLLERGDETRLTTNHIAERAGVGIGSLYEYFTDKDDILQPCGEARRSGFASNLSSGRMLTQTATGRV